MADKQVYVRWLNNSNEVTDLLQTFVNRGHDLNDYFLNITMAANGNGCKSFVVFYDKRYEEDKPTIT